MRLIPSDVYDRLKARQQIGDYRPNHEVHLLKRNASQDYIPFWPEATPKEEWKLPSYRPWKIVQGHDVASAEYTQQRISNWIPTNEGRMVCAWVQDVGGTNRIVWCYTSDEQNFLVNNYPGEEIVVDTTIALTELTGGLSLTRFSEDGVWKIMLITRDRDPADSIGHSGTAVRCYVSPSGNGYGVIGGDKVSDLVLRSLVWKNSFLPWWNPAVHSLFGWTADQNWNYGIVNDCYIRDDGGLILATCINGNFGPDSSGRVIPGAGRGGWTIFYSGDNGATWSRVYQASSWSGAYRSSICKPVDIKGLLVVGGQIGNRQGIITSATDGSAWTYHGLMPSRAYSAVNRSLGDSYYYDEDEDVLYSATPGAFAGSYIWTLEDPTIERLFEVAATPQNLPGSSAVNYSIWDPLMYIYGNNNTSCHFYKTPQGRLAVQWSTSEAWSETFGETSGPMTVIIGFRPTLDTMPLRAKHIHISRSRTAGSALNIAFDNKDGILTPENSSSPYHMLLWMNNEIIVRQGYGDNLVQTFSGLIDSPRPRRNPDYAEIEVVARDYYKLCLDQIITHPTTGAHAIHAVGPVEDIFRTLAAWAGFAGGKIVTEATGMSIEKDFSWESYADAMQWLAEVVNFEIIVDEYGTIHFLRHHERGSTFAPDYVFREGEDIIRIDYEIDDDELYSEVVVFGKDENGDVIEARADYAPRDYYQVLAQKILPIHSSLTTLAECQELADRTIALMLSKPRCADFAAIGVPELQPGDRVRVIESTTRISEIYRVDEMDIMQEPDSLLMALRTHHYGAPDPEGGP